MIGMFPFQAFGRVTGLTNPDDLELVRNKIITFELMAIT